MPFCRTPVFLRCVVQHYVRSRDHQLDATTDDMIKKRHILNYVVFAVKLSLHDERLLLQFYGEGCHSRMRWGGMSGRHAGEGACGTWKGGSQGKIKTPTFVVHVPNGTDGKERKEGEKGNGCALTIFSSDTRI